ncbi:MAG: hypothetical protein CMI53_04745 [Parcubacteria group bacterium]|nr:hypothetical protein [Parcubacteria group bacterium]|tara:strand:+ start:4621 stop:6180 length:1560 start_codon:yes stop_codon:yes gene_type:complete
MANSKKKQKKQNNSKSEDVKSDFITVASHQLRTPISAIRWSLDTLLSARTGKLSDKQKEIVSQAYQNNKFMVKVVNDLLRVSRLEEKGINLVPKFVNFEKLVKELLSRHKYFADACNCKISIVVENNLPKVYIDPLQIKPVINGLIDNAIRYGRDKGTVKINLKKSKNRVLFKIEDKGIGIPLNQKDLVFSQFFRAQNAMKTQTEGLGLDLYLAKKIIEASGGEINFSSVVNKGTIFNAYLPISKNQVKENDDEKIKKIVEENPEDILKKEREFVSITVHELKAPLGLSKWSLEMLKGGKSGNLTEKQLGLIDQVYRGNERLLVLVRDLLNLSKLQEGKFEIKPERIQLSKDIFQVVDGFHIEAKRKNINLQLVKPKNKLPKVIADRNRIAQVATNLISNAIKYTPANGKVIVSLKKISGKKLEDMSDDNTTVNINHTDNKKGYLVFSVKDSGIGISDKDQKKLFSRFFRSEKVLESETEGTGLGLYITKSIINLHKGDIWFKSKLGHGSEFYFSLPIA